MKNTYQFCPHVVSQAVRTVRNLQRTLKKIYANLYGIVYRGSISQYNLNSHYKEKWNRGIFRHMQCKSAKITSGQLVSGHGCWFLEHIDRHRDI